MRRPPVALTGADALAGGERTGERYGIGVDTYGWASSMDVHARIRGNTIAGLDYGIALVDSDGNAAPWMDVTIGGAEGFANSFRGNAAEEVILATIDDDIDGTFNDWGVYTEDEIEDEIYHYVDDPALGLIDYSDFINEMAAVPEPADGRPVRSWTVWPNPFRERIEVRLSISESSPSEFDIFSVDGRNVTHWEVRSGGNAQAVFTWDGRDIAGHPVSPGVYLLRGTVGDRVVSSGRIVRIR